jgi:hypothetical protein
MSFAPHAHAAATLYTTKEDGTPADYFTVGEKIKVVATGVKASRTAPASLFICDPQGIVRKTISVYTSYYVGTFSDITDKPGLWKVSIKENSTPSAKPDSEINTSSDLKSAATTTQYTATVQNVVPESPIGTLSIALAMVLGLGFGMVKLRRSEPTKYR